MLYMWMEVIYHIPLSVWAVGALLRGEFVVLDLVVTIIRGAWFAD